MPLSICYPSIWILILLLKLTVTANTKYSKQNISSSPDIQEKHLMHECFGGFWKRKLLYKNELVLKLSNEQFENGSVKKNVQNFEKNARENVSEKTLIDYDGPTIMEDFDNRDGQDYPNHVRVKRNEPRNKSIIYRRFINISNSSPQNFWYDNNQSSYTSNDSMFKTEESYVNPSYGNLSYFLNGIVMDTFHPRYKRGLLPKNGKRKKRVKGKSRHSKHHMRNKAKNTKHNTISRKRTMKTIYNSGKRNKKEMRVDRFVRAITIDSLVKPKIRERKSENSNFSSSIASTASTDYERVSMKENTSLLIDDRNSDVKQHSDAIIFPFVHTEEAELRIYIKKMPTNETSSLNRSTCPNYSPEISLHSVTPPKYITDKIINITIINPASALNFDLKNEIDNLTIETTSKESDYQSSACNYEMNDCGNTLSHNAEFHISESNLRNIGNDGISKNNKYKDANNEISAESLNEKTKSRAKRNQARLSGTKALGMNDFKNVKEMASIAAIDESKTHDNRAVRSIEEIKQLTERLIAKVKELQTYTSNNSATGNKEMEKKTKALYITDFCDNKNTNNMVSGKTRISSENLNPKCKMIHNIDKQGLIKIGEQTDSMEKRAYQPHIARFARREYREKRKPHRKWGKWMDWSSCSVTCGKGRQIRWRHCIRDCDEAETEMEEKACQLPACPSGKFLGIF